MRNHIYDADLKGVMLRGGNGFRPLIQVLTGTFTVVDGMPQYLVLNPGGGNRTVLLPSLATSKGKFYRIMNIALVGEDLTIKDSTNTTTFAIVNQGGIVDMYCDGVAWHTFWSAGSALQSGGFTFPRPAHTFVNTGGAGTYTAAALIAGRILRDCAGASRTDTTATAAQLVAALPGVRVGDSIETYLANVSDPITELITVQGGAGVTISTDIQTASLNLAGAAARVLQFRFTNVTPSSEAATLTF